MNYKLNDFIYPCRNLEKLKRNFLIISRKYELFVFNSGVGTSEALGADASYNFLKVRVITGVRKDLG